jgi:2-dehydro-3-deoxyphosphogluconate aldolase/(4S)-4-hydroxy-2-oxoglutarate aldolase
MRIPLPPSATESGVVAVLRADAAEKYLAVCATLVAAGVTALELTLTTPGTIEVLPHLRRELPDAHFGVGTILDRRDLAGAVAAGAEFLVTPVSDTTLVASAVEAGIPIIPGAFTPTEVHAAWRSGASAVKIFPASTVGPDYLSQLAGPFPQILTMPSGGVGLDEISPWIRAGASAVSLGGPLLGDALRGGDLGALRDRALLAVGRVRAARSERS